MRPFVPYLTQEVIERDAAALLAEYEQARGVTIVPPIPIEDIVEKHLKLTIEFDDTHKLFGLAREPNTDIDILGAIFFDEARIVIDESLDPEETPWMEGRYRHTVAHEGCGHWRLHRLLFSTALASPLGRSTEPSVICRSTQAKERVEWQADFYASCLLMPRNTVLAAWKNRLGDTKARVLRRTSRLDPSRVDDPDLRDVIVTCERKKDDDFLDRFVRPFAMRFKVSPIAMRIRLEQIGLLRRAVTNQRKPARGA